MRYGSCTKGIKRNKRIKGINVEKEKFYELIENIIVPLFTGSEIAGEEPSSIRDADVAQGLGGTILCKPEKSAEYRLIIKREQPFKRYEIQLVNAILEELKGVLKYNIAEGAYTKALTQYALERAICRSVSEKNYDTLHSLIYELTHWGFRTYEGDRPNFGFIVSPRNINYNSSRKVHFTKILDKDFSALLSDGRDGVMFLNSKGYLMGYYSLPNVIDQNTYAPYEYIKVAKSCKQGRIGVCLIPNGDILIFSEGELVFANSHGSWSSFSHEEIIQKLADRTGDLRVQESVYLSALDVSFCSAGACICFLKKDQEKNAIAHIDLSDIIIEGYYNKKKEMLINEREEMLSRLDVENGENVEVEELLEYEDFLKADKGIKVAALIKIINGRKFYELDRKLRADLLSIDGATVLDHEGNIIAVGAIVKIGAGSSGGGRLAAAKTLARYGVAMKVSTDNTITGYTYDAKKGKVKSLFFI